MFPGNRVYLRKTNDFVNKIIPIFLYFLKKKKKETVKDSLFYSKKYVLQIVMVR